MIKYVVRPTRIISVNDGQTHYVGSQALIRLYGVNPRECIIYDERLPDESARRLYANLIWLQVRYRGNYPNLGAGDDYYKESGSC